ncbi:UvrD-helicase domain-containing protein [Lacibacter sp.]|uniref:UvrD-helicase domain-containing protein n=1 Tax=Lacibacter sp. TaxID=1915409 RepID=UPI002B4B1D5D|nr:UvrD-helicase domain-containing protein [Lacibacter sp.]HLP37747.1 UvrD-helicase domain-containing protein [Lacibacter sp.]
MENHHTKTPHSLTSEQEGIITTNSNIVINAVAGSGKTTTVIEYAASRPAGSKILYLAFNKSVKLEAQRKFAEKGLHNVKVETAHSLAFNHICRGSSYTIKSNGYKTTEIVELLQLTGNEKKHTEHIIANHINKFITFFCNSNKQKVQQLNYIDTITDPKAKIVVQTFYPQIVEGTRLLLAKMDRAEIEIIHDFYLKKFQLSNPVLNYNYILFDEGQDASEAMLDIFLKQNAVKVIVGDTHQQIYGWRHAVNSLSKVNFNILHLSASFRFSRDIANLAAQILELKKNLVDYNPVNITGKGNTTAVNSSATIARSNLGLLLNAINYITENPKVNHIHFEGNINSYTYADDGASLYDVLNLYNQKHDLIRDKLISSMKDIDELEEYIESTEDGQLKMMLEIVKEYENEIPDLINRLKKLQVKDEDRHKARMIFSTVHRAKGMEYDAVHLVNDFITAEKVERIKNELKKDQEPIDVSKTNEEINLLYVAITRTKNKLYIPQNLIPTNFPASPSIVIVKENDASPKNTLKDFFKSRSAVPTAGRKPSGIEIKKKAYTLAEKREIHKGAYNPWTPQLDEELKSLFEDDYSISDLAHHFGRTRGGIISRLKKLNLFDE